MMGLLFEVNWSNISSDWASWIMTGYDNVFQHWTYPLIFLGVVGYVYCINRSAVSAAVAICLVFGIYGITGVFQYGDIAEFSMLSWIIVIVAFSALFTTLFVSVGKRRSV